VWRSLENFLGSVDFGPRLFGDLVWHYYPMWRHIYWLGAPVPGYLYTASFGVLLSPLGLLTLPQATAAWAVVQAGLAAWLCYLCGWRLLALSHRDRVLFVLLFATSYPLLSNLKWGQTSTLITLLMLGCSWAYARGRRLPAAVLLALAVCVKYYAGVFALVPLLRRDGRFVAAFLAATVALLCVVPAAALGPAAWVGFERSVAAALATAPQWVMDGSNSQYLGCAVLRLLHPEGGPGAASPAELSVLVWIGYAWFAANLVVVWRTLRRHADEWPLVSSVLLLLSLPLAVKTSWPHYLVYLPLCQAAALSWVGRTGWARRDLWPSAGLAVLSIALASAPVFNAFPDWWTYNWNGMLFWSNLALLVGVYVLVARDGVPGVPRRTRCG
jgi:hypothetical protein